MNENGQRWLEAAAASSATFEEAEEIRQRISLEKARKEREDAVYETQRSLARFCRSDEFGAAVSLLKSLKRSIFLGEYGDKRFLLTGAGLEQHEGDLFTVLPSSVLELKDAGEAFFRWKGPNIKPEGFLTDQLNVMANEVLQGTVSA